MSRLRSRSGRGAFPWNVGRPDLNPAEGLPHASAPRGAWQGPLAHLEQHGRRRERLALQAAPLLALAGFALFGVGAWQADRARGWLFAQGIPLRSHHGLGREAKPVPRPGGATEPAHPRNLWPLPNPEPEGRALLVSGGLAMLTAAALVLFAALSREEQSMATPEQERETAGALRELAREVRRLGLGETTSPHGALGGLATVFARLSESIQMLATAGQAQAAAGQREAAARERGAGALERLAEAASLSALGDLLDAAPSPSKPEALDGRTTAALEALRARLDAEQAMGRAGAPALDPEAV